jgi:hypothetical protein
MGGIYEFLTVRGKWNVGKILPPELVFLSARDERKSPHSRTTGIRPGHDHVPAEIVVLAPAQGRVVRESYGFFAVLWM